MTRLLALDACEDRLLPSALGPDRAFGHAVPPPDWEAVRAVRFADATPDRSDRPDRVFVGRAMRLAERVEVPTVVLVRAGLPEPVVVPADWAVALTVPTPQPAELAAVRAAVAERLAADPVPEAPPPPVIAAAIARAEVAARRSAVLAERPAPVFLSPPADDRPAEQEYSAREAFTATVPVTIAPGDATPTPSSAPPAAAWLVAAPPTTPTPEPVEPPTAAALPTIVLTAPAPTPAAEPVEPPAASPLAGLLPFDPAQLEEAARGLLDQLAELAGASADEPGGTDNTLWLTAAALVAAGVGFTAHGRRAGRAADRVVLGTDSVLARWQEKCRDPGPR